MFMWSTEASQFFLTKLSGLQGLDFVEVCTLPVSFGEWLLAQLSGDGSTCRVWCLSRVLGTGNTGVTGTGEAGLTSPTGIAECCLVSVSFAAATNYQLAAFYLHIRVQLRRPLHLQEAAYLLAWAGQQEHMRVYLQWLDVFLVHIGLNSCIS